MGMLQEFREFAVKGNVIDLAVGVIIGAAFGKIVDSLVSDLIMPVVGLVFGKLDFSSMFVLLGTVPPGTAMSLDALKKAGVPVFAYGHFLTVTVNFVILAFIIFLMVKQINRLRGITRPHHRPAPTAGRHRAAARDPRQPEAALSASAEQQAGAPCASPPAGWRHRPARARDVEGRAVVRAGAHQRQAQRDVDALLHAQVLDRDQALVVVHRHHHVELAGAGAARMNTVSGAKGPLASMPSARAA
jgi:large conductance mechanosensitive channel